MCWQELETTLIDMEHILGETRGSLANAEKRRNALMAELEDCRAALDNVGGLATIIACAHDTPYSGVQCRWAYCNAKTMHAMSP